MTERPMVEIANAIRRLGEARGPIETLARAMALRRIVLAHDMTFAELSDWILARDEYQRELAFRFPYTTR
jgi:hypothetical protein